jgi:hypothetical protein
MSTKSLSLEFIMPSANKKSSKSSSGPKLSEFPCGDFREGDDFSGTCQACGHSQEAHEFTVPENSGMQVSTDGKISMLVGISKMTPQLGAGLYSLQSSMSGLFLRHMQPFDLPEKVYGDCAEFSRRVLKTFKSLSRGMGVLLSGGKGTGKTLTAKILAQQAMNSGLPVIMIQHPFSGPGLLSFLEKLPNRCLFFIDEWEKIYGDDNSRKFFLGVLDGTVRSRHLWVMTTNTEDVGPYFLSRPGRIRYHKKYDGLPEGFIRGIVHDHIKDPDLSEAVIAAAQSIYNISPDVLMVMIEESLLHNETPDKFMHIFNVVPELPAYDVEVKFQLMSVDVPEDIIRSWKEMGDAKLRLCTMQLQQCRQFISDLSGYDRDNDDDVFIPNDLERFLAEKYPDVAQFVQCRVVRSTKGWCNPFHYADNGKLFVNIDYLSYGDESFEWGTKRGMVHFRISHEDVKDVIRDGTKVTVIAKNGDRVVATPAKKFTRYNSRFDNDPGAGTTFD